MSGNHYTDAAQCKLSDHITPDVFRTVLYEQYKMPGGGVSEIPVEITLKKENAKRLCFKAPSDGLLYGFARIRPKVNELFGAQKAKLFINDWDDKFVMVYELDEKDEKAFFITIDEVLDLLEKCRRVPEQKKSSHQ
jgi:hypothetical protein